MSSPPSTSSQTPSPNRSSRGRFLFPFRSRTREQMFVPSTQYIVSRGSGTDYVRSISNSAFYDAMFPSLLGPSSRDSRKTSEPSNISQCDSQPSSSSAFSPLTIETGNGECAGSEHFTLFPDNEQCDNRIIRKAQEMGLSNMRQALKQINEEREMLRRDTRLLNEILDTELAEFANMHEDDVETDIARIEKQIEHLRKSRPDILPPPIPRRPPRAASPETEDWQCASTSCAAANNYAVLRCIKCGLPRPLVSNNERRRCNCRSCLQAKETDRLSVVPAIDDVGWVFVDHEA